MTTTARTGPVTSPCTSVCRMDPASGWCVGCLRTIDEIASWSTMDDEARREVWQRLVQRREQVGGGLPVVASRNVAP